MELIDGTFARELPEPSVLESHLIGLYVEGAAELWRPGGADPIVAGELLVSSPGHVVRVLRRLSPRGRLRTLLVTPAAMAAALAGVLGATVPARRTHVVRGGEVRARAEGLLRALDDDAEPLAVQSAFTEVVAAVSGVTDDGAQAAPADRALRRVRELLHDDVGRNVGLDELAAVARLSKFHLVRRFTVAYGLPPHRYHLQLRLERARAMLLAGGAIGDVASELAFADQSHLTRRFARLYGVTPARYRRRMIER